MVQSQEASQLTIAGLAKAGDVGVETVRYYQQRGLLETPKRPGTRGLSAGIRKYGDADVRRLRFIRAAQVAGFSLEEIGELIALDATDGRARALELARGRIAALDAKIAELQAARHALMHLAGQCSAPSPGPCPILTAFDHT